MPTDSFNDTTATLMMVYLQAEALFTSLKIP